MTRLGTRTSQISQPGRNCIILYRRHAWSPYLSDDDLNRNLATYSQTNLFVGRVCLHLKGVLDILIEQIKANCYPPVAHLEQGLKERCQLEKKMQDNAKLSPCLSIMQWRLSSTHSKPC